MRAIPSDLSLLDPDRIVDLDLFSEETRQNWRELAAQWATRVPFYVINFGIPQVVTSRHADVRSVYQQAELFTQRLPGDEKFTDPLNAMPQMQKLTGARHRRMRAIFAEWFGAAGVDRFEPAIKEEVKQLVDELEAQGNEVDIVSQFSSKLIPRIFLGRLCGLNEEQQQAFLRLRAARDVLTSLSAFFPSYMEAFNHARAVTEEIIAEQEARPRGPIGGLVGAQADADPISYDEVVGNIFLLFFGALGNTSIETTALLFHRMRYRDQFELLRTEPELISSAIEESLRLHPSGIVDGTGVVRFATEDTEIGGTKIWQGMPVQTAVTAANLDPTVYPDPLRFDIRRDPKQILTFGSGPHYCIGGILAQRIITVCLREFMQRFPDMQLVDPNFEFKYRGQHTELSPVDMPVRLR